MKVKTRHIIAIVVAVLLAAVCLRLLLLETTLKYGLILLGALVLAFLIWKAFIRNGQKELRESEQQNLALQSELDNLRQRLDEMGR